MSGEWGDGYRTGKLEMFVEIMKTLDEYIYGPYKNGTMRAYARNIRAEFDNKFMVFQEEELRND